MGVIYDPTRLEARLVGFENHLNYFHSRGRGLLPDLAQGLAVFLNSSVLDRYFRLFSGHTQVNATDLRKFAVRRADAALGREAETILPDQQRIDSAVEKVCSQNGQT